MEMKAWFGEGEKEERPWSWRLSGWDRRIQQRKRIKKKKVDLNFIIHMCNFYWTNIIHVSLDTLYM